MLWMKQDSSVAIGVTLPRSLPLHQASSADISPKYAGQVSDHCDSLVGDDVAALLLAVLLLRRRHRHGPCWISLFSMGMATATALIVLESSPESFLQHESFDSCKSHFLDSVVPKLSPLAMADPRFLWCEVDLVPSRKWNWLQS